MPAEEPCHIQFIKDIRLIFKPAHLCRVTHRSIQDGGYKVIPDALHLILGFISPVQLFRLSEDRALWVHCNNLNESRRIFSDAWLLHLCVTYKTAIYMILFQFNIMWFTLPVIIFLADIWSGVFVTKLVHFTKLLCIRSQGQSVSTLIFGHFSFSLRAMPVIVPPVPAPATNISTLPVVSWIKIIVHQKMNIY